MALCRPVSLPPKLHTPAHRIGWAERRQENSSNQITRTQGALTQTNCARKIPSAKPNRLPPHSHTAAFNCSLRALSKMCFINYNRTSSAQQKRQKAKLKMNRRRSPGLIARDKCGIRTATAVLPVAVDRIVPRAMCVAFSHFNFIHTAYINWYNLSNSVHRGMLSIRHSYRAVLFPAAAPNAFNNNNKNNTYGALCMCVRVVYRNNAAHKVKPTMPSRINCSARSALQRTIAAPNNQ